VTGSRNWCPEEKSALRKRGKIVDRSEGMQRREQDSNGVKSESCKSANRPLGWARNSVCTENSHEKKRGIEGRESMGTQ